MKLIMSKKRRVLLSRPSIIKGHLKSCLWCSEPYHVSQNGPPSCQSSSHCQSPPNSHNMKSLYEDILFAKYYIYHSKQDHWATIALFRNGSFKKGKCYYQTGGDGGSHKRFGKWDDKVFLSNLVKEEDPCILNDIVELFSSCNKSQAELLVLCPVVRVTFYEIKKKSGSKTLANGVDCIKNHLALSVPNPGMFLAGRSSLTPSLGSSSPSNST